MANEVVGIDIVARLDRFRKEMAEIPDIGAKEARALTGQLSREIKKAERAATQANKRQRDSFKELRKTLIDTQLSLELLKKGYDLLKKGIGATVDRARELDKALGGELNPAIDEAATAGRRLLDQFVEPMIPGMTDLVDLTRDYFSSLSDVGLVREFGEALGDVMGGASLAARELFGLNEETKQLIKLRNEENGAIERQAERVMALRKEIEDAQLGDAFAGMGDVGKANVESLNQELQTQIEVLRTLRGEVNKDRGARAAASAPRRAKESEEAAVREVAAEKSAAAGIVAARAEARRAYVDAANERQRLADQEIEEAARVAAAHKKALDEVTQARMEAAAEQREIQTSIATTAIQTAASVADSIIDGLKHLAMANVKEARERRDVELGLAILRGELQAAAAFGTTLATYGGTPAGFALAAAAAAAVGISSKAAAAAAHSQSAEKFHSGGVFRANNEGPATLRDGEGVLTPPAVRRLGGARALDAMNASADGGGDGGMALIIDGRAYDATVRSALGRRGSPLTKSLSSLRAKPGSHRPHG